MCAFVTKKEGLCFSRSKAAWRFRTSFPQKVSEPLIMGKVLGA